MFDRLSESITHFTNITLTPENLLEPYFFTRRINHNQGSAFLFFLPIMEL